MDRALPKGPLVNSLVDSRVDKRVDSLHRRSRRTVEFSDDAPAMGDDSDSQKVCPPICEINKKLGSMVVMTVYQGVEREEEGLESMLDDHVAPPVRSCAPTLCDPTLFSPTFR